VPVQIHVKTPICRGKVLPARDLCVEGAIEPSKFPVFFPVSREFWQRIVRERLDPPPRFPSEAEPVTRYAARFACEEKKQQSIQSSWIVLCAAYTRSEEGSINQAAPTKRRALSICAGWGAALQSQYRGGDFLLRRRNEENCRIVAASISGISILFLICCAASNAQTKAAPAESGYHDLRDLVAIPSVSGHEEQLAAEIRGRIAASRLSPKAVTDNLGDVVVTIGSGTPNRLIVTPIDEPGFVVSGITDDGYLRLQRLAQSSLSSIFNELYSAQPVKVGIANGKWIDGAVAGLSVHLQNGRTEPPKSSDIENMYVDIGASSAAEARKAGVDNLSPVAVNRAFSPLGHVKLAGASIGDKFGAEALVELLENIDPAKVKGTLTIAFVVQQWAGARGLGRILGTAHADEMIYVGRLLPGGLVAGIEGVHRAPRREPGSGVLLGLEETNGSLKGLAADLKQLADANKIPLVNDYSAGLIPPSYGPAPAFPARWAHLGISTAWHDTPAEMIDDGDLSQLETLLKNYAQNGAPPSLWAPIFHIYTSEMTAFTFASSHLSNTELLSRLIIVYGASGHEESVREKVKSLLPPWAKPETDDAGNLILHLGRAPVDSKSPKIFVIAHTDEIGFEVKSISKDGRLEVRTLGGFDLSYYEGHSALVHTAGGDRDAIMELPNGWDEPNFKWPAISEAAIRVDVGARSPEEVAKLGIKAGDYVTIPKEYRSLLGTRASARSLDDRVGCAALISAVWALGGPVKDRDVTLVWSTGEETGLDGATALAKRMAADGRVPDYVFAVDTFVSSDSPLESKRFADAELGKGFVVRAIDASNIVPPDLVEKVVKLARSNQIPVQYGVTGGGNDGSVFVPYGSVDVALGWPLRYSHSPAEVVDTRDVDALTRIVAAIAKSW
jgi:putative aminopeptidase